MCYADKPQQTAKQWLQGKKHQNTPADLWKIISDSTNKDICVYPITAKSILYKKVFALLLFLAQA